jgi:uncharacterized membrane protein
MFTPLILIHLAAILLGTFVMTQTKGSPRHRLLGRIWVSLILLTAVSSFWLQSEGHFSWIHLLSVWIIVSMGIAVHAIRQQNVQRHLRFMRGSYVSLLVAGAFTLLPFRRLGNLLWHSVGLV